MRYMVTISDDRAKEGTAKGGTSMAGGTNILLETRD